MCGDYRPDMYQLKWFAICRGEEDIPGILAQVEKILKHRMEEVNCVRVDMTIPYDDYWDALDYIDSPKIEGEWDGQLREGKEYNIIPPPNPNEPDGE